ncbi:hypothetical protein WJ78_18040 [Burkholderia ubonensis]|uniref:hypothetical protein n=1 Tax=Burkholderia ubonensis TaxID=101571 RepID=UPI000752351B|nr:hypothetical protein [Burkholderia ubonensis]KVO65019.1 hypothetical protein WJ78_18040 [Burkholderia ubonensis]KVP90014.1 hypothetical protein WJ97_23825 [Burkholderia ubonensis]
MSCGYQGAHFGAHYEDGCCIDGYLWDLDSCDEPGGPLHNGGDEPCPRCNTREYVLGCDDLHLTGNAKQRRTQVRAAIRRVRSWAAA